MTKITDEIKSLFDRVRSILGAPIRTVELTDKQLCDLLQVAIEDYGEKVQNEIIANNWCGFYGKNVNNSTELAHAFMTRSLDLSKEYSYWFSKQVGLQQEGPWELKKDFIEIEAGKQVYVIPSGRTVNKVMYVNPPMTDTALFANYMGAGVGFMPGLGQVGAGYGYGAGMGGFYTTQACDVAYLASDLNFKSRLFRGDLVYKITAGPNGTHLLHLLSTPGSKLSFGFAGIGTSGGVGLIGCQVWYTYYDTTSEEDADECMRYHANDVILSPDQVPMQQLDFAFLNEPAKVIVRQLLVAKAKETLGLIRGKFSGKVNIPQAEMSMDYQMLIQQGKEEYNAAMEALTKRLERLRPTNMMEEQAKLVESQNKIQQYTPLGIYVI
jgi:hypothetical protein